MFEIYNLKLDDFIDNSLFEYIYIIKSDVSEFVTETEDDGTLYHFTIDDFQEMAEYIRFCLVKNDFGIAKKPTHYEKKTFDKKKFAEEYDSHLKALKPELIKNLQLIQEDDILECYSLYANWWHVMYSSIFLIAKTKQGYLAFDYALTI